MILFVLESGNTLPERLAIPDDRVKHIVEAVRNEVTLLQADKTSTQLSMHYKALAEVCDSIEEYTLAMHAFLFTITELGDLSVKKKLSQNEV